VFIIPNLGLAELRREAIGEDEFLRASIPVAVAERLTGNSSQRRSNPVRTPDAEAELQRGFARLLNADVDIILGTDAGALPDHFFGYSGHRELEIFVRLGLTPMQALMAGTSKPAQRLGLNDLGLIRPGMSADLLVLNANPLDDIRNTRTITRVYLRGSEIDRSLILENMARRYNSQ
jgi:imidazolonepropionase-like amidohydrolase